MVPKRFGGKEERRDRRGVGCLIGLIAAPHVGSAVIGQRGRSIGRVTGFMMLKLHSANYAQ